MSAEQPPLDEQPDHLSTVSAYITMGEYCSGELERLSVSSLQSGEYIVRLKEGWLRPNVLQKEANYAAEALVDVYGVSEAKASAKHYRVRFRSPIKIGTAAHEVVCSADGMIFEGQPYNTVGYFLPAKIDEATVWRSLEKRPPPTGSSES